MSWTLLNQVVNVLDTVELSCSCPRRCWIKLSVSWTLLNKAASVHVLDAFMSMAVMGPHVNRAQSGKVCVHQSLWKARFQGAGAHAWGWWRHTFIIQACQQAQSMHVCQHRHRLWRSQYMVLPLLIMATCNAMQCTSCGPLCVCARVRARGCMYFFKGLTAGNCGTQPDKHVF